MTRRRLIGAGLAFLTYAAGAALIAGAQATPEPPLGPLSRDAATALMPPTVFFAGQAAPVQGRNTAGARMPGGVLVAGLVDTAGYSSGVQERYQAYLLLDTAVRFGEHALGPGAYGCGVVDGAFLVMDLSAKVLWKLPALREAELARPNPLQVAAVKEPCTFRLYFGRFYAAFSPEGGGAGQ